MLVCSDAYVAGLFDGEGCLCITPISRRGAGSDGSYTVTASLTLRDRDSSVLDRIQELWGGKIYTKHKATETCAAARSWMLWGHNKVSRFVKDILPYLQVKEVQGRVAIAFCDTKQKPRGPVPMPDHIISLRQQCYTTMRHLNRRGPD